MTREQIGQALEYSEPMKQVAKIHERHKGRLDKFSFVEMTNGRNIYFYSMKGVYEIYRWSRQPKADEFIDFVWNVMEAIRKGEFSIEPIQLQCMRETNKTLKFIQNRNLKDSIARQVLSKIYNIDIPPKEVGSFIANDAVEEFINSQCEKTGKVKIGELHEAYVKWCRAERMKALSKVKFGKKVELLGFEKVHLGMGRCWTGIQLKVEERRKGEK